MSDDLACTDLPDVLLPGRSSTKTETGKQLGSLLARTGRYFMYGGSLVRRDDNLGRIGLTPLTPSQTSSIFESVARLCRHRPTKDDPDGIEQTICSPSEAKGIVDTDGFKESLGVVRILSRCPVLIERGGELVVVTGYDRESGILAGGPPPDEKMGHMDAAQLLKKVVQDFDFATEGDRARAIAALLSPAMVQGGLLPRLAPIDFGGADQSQSGKGYRNKLLAAIYNDEFATITMPRGGGLKQVLGASLASGARFISLDNFRGDLKDPTLESLMTETGLMVLVSGRVLQVDPRGITVSLTSNGICGLPDLANRVSMVRIRKQPQGYQYAKYPEGDILAHIKANQPKFLGAVFTVIKAWHFLGKDESTENRHSFVHWSRPLDYIVQCFFGTVPLLTGHKEAQAAIADERLKWLQQVGQCIIDAGHEGEDLRTGQILDVLLPHAKQDDKPDSPGIEIPNYSWERDVSDPSIRKGLMQALGSRLKAYFYQSDEQDAGGVLATHTSKRRKGTGRRDEVYRFVRSTKHVETLAFEVRDEFP